MLRREQYNRRLGLVWAACLVACSSNQPSSADASGGSPTTTSGGKSAASGGATPSSSGGVSGNTDISGEVPADLRQKLEDASALSSSTLLSQYATSFTSKLDYAPAQATWLDRIQASSLALNSAETNALADRGFVLSDRLKQPNFFYSYKSIYFEHLPLYVSADSILYAVHRSYDSLLSNVESSALEPTLQRLLSNLRQRVTGSALKDTTRADLSLYLGVAGDLLQPNTGENDAAVADIVAQAKAASGPGSFNLFGAERDEDFSQFEPRGHYTEGLQNYFRAMMWLGRVDFRLIETQPDHTRVLNRRAVEAMLGLRELFDDGNKQDLALLESVIGAFVGEPDYMTFSQIDQLLADLKISSSSELASLSDAQIESAIEQGGYGAQRIASHLLVNGLDSSPLPLNSSFALLGQRYVIDSNVFSNVVYDRVLSEPLRLMPNPLDVAFAALGNNQAASLLSSELDHYHYAGALAATRVLVDAHPRDYWDSSLYTLWLGALRQLSPSDDSSGLPSVAQSEAWGRRLLNTQLASWAELRHDTLLYAKQSYTGIPGCEYPDAYVDPYPKVFEGLRRFAESGQQLLGVLKGTAFEPTGALNYLSNLASVTTMLRDMAEAERAGQPHSDAAIAFINQAVTINQVEVVCTTVDVPSGWYAQLFFNSDDVMDFDPTIADVHTQPADEVGNPVGKVLHVGTGNVRTMVVTVDSCNGPRAYVGPVSSYFEQTTDNFARLTDEKWAEAVKSTSPADVPWLSDLIER